MPRPSPSRLFRRIARGNLGGMRACIKAGTPLNVTEACSGFTPLLCAVNARALDIVRELLVVHHVDVNGRGATDDPPILLALKRGFADVAELLLTVECINVSCADATTLNTVLHYAVRMRNRALVSSLLRRGANASVVNARDQTPFAYAIATTAYVNEESILLAQLLLRHTLPVCVNQLDCEGHTALYAAAQRGSIAFTAMILNVRGVKVDACGTDGDTPLYIAAQAGHAPVVQQLVSADACTDCMNAATHRTPIFAATKGGHFATVQVLAPHPCCVNDACDDELALDVAVNGNDELTASALLTAGADVDALSAREADPPLCRAVASGNLDMVGLLLAAHANVDLVGSNFNSPLLIAVKANAPHMVALLLAHGAVVHYELLVEDPVSVAAECGFNEILDMLLVAVAQQEAP